MRKSARLSPIGPQVFEIECGSGLSLHPLPRRRRRLLHRTPGVGERGRKLARLSAELLPDVDDLRPKYDKQNSRASRDSMTRPEMYEVTEDETSDEKHDIADKRFEKAANLLLTLCQQNDMEKHGEIERNPMSDRDGNPSNDVVHCGRSPQRLESLATDETVSTSVNGILGASYDFWDEDEEDVDGSPIIRVEE